MTIVDTIQQYVTEHPRNYTSYQLQRNEKLIPLIEQSLHRLGITKIGSLAAGNRALVFVEPVHQQTIKLAIPGEEVWGKSKWARELFKPFDITQHMEYIRTRKGPLIPIDGIVMKIAPMLTLVKDLPTEDQTKAGLEYEQAFRRRTGITSEYKPENIAVITDSNGTAVKPKSPDLSYLYIPVDLGELYVERPETDRVHIQEYLERGRDAQGAYKNTLEKHYPNLRGGGRVIGQDGTVHKAKRQHIPDSYPF